VEKTLTNKYPVKPEALLPSDVPYSFSAARIPDHISWRSHYPPAWNQLDLGSCTAQASCAAAYYFDSSLDPSRLFQYYNERKLNGDVQEDAGSSIRTSLVAGQQFGFCPEAEWPYNQAVFEEAPPAQCYSDAKKDVYKSFYRIAPRDGIDTINAIRNAVAIGQPVLIGIVVYEGIESQAAAETGVIPLPTIEQQPLGGHAVCLTGYDSTKELFEFRNSWGPDWGDGGYGWLPFQYLLQYLESVWVVTG